MREYKPGMRVVVRDGPWPEHRCAGHYGKVLDAKTDRVNTRVRVAITGHVDRGEPMPIVQEIGLVDWFFTDELDVVD